MLREGRGKLAANCTWQCQACTRLIACCAAEYAKWGALATLDSAWHAGRAAEIKSATFSVFSTASLYRKSRVHAMPIARLPVFPFFSGVRLLLCYDRRMLAPSTFPGAPLLTGPSFTQCAPCVVHGAQPARVEATLTALPFLTKSSLPFRFFAFLCACSRCKARLFPYKPVIIAYKTGNS